MKATSALIPELKEKIENLINCLSGTIMTFPYIVTEVIKIIPTEATQLFEAGKLYKLICETTLEGRSNLHTLGLVIGWDSYDLMKIANKMEVDHESTCEMLQELLKQYLTIYSTWEYESKLLSGENHDNAELAAELVKRESMLFTADIVQNEDLAAFIEDKINGIEKNKLSAPIPIEYCGDYEAGDMVIVAGRPGMGKSMYLLNCALEWAVKGKRGILFSLEMPIIQLKARLLSMITGEDSKNAKNSPNKDLLRKKSLEIDSFPIVFSTTEKLNQIEAKCKLENLAKPIDYVLIDYVQLITANGKKNGNREQEIAEIARTIKRLAVNLNIPIIILAQLSRAVESRGDKRPQLSDLRESGSLEQEADIVKFLYRPEYYGINEDFEGKSTTGKAEIIVAKYRNGKAGTNIVNFDYIQGFTANIQSYNNPSHFRPALGFDDYFGN
jgi:replicative DNA helicase